MTAYLRRARSLRQTFVAVADQAAFSVGNALVVLFAVHAGGLRLAGVVTLVQTGYVLATTLCQGAALEGTVIRGRLEAAEARSIGLGIAVVVGILLFGAIASGIRQVGWNEGFTAGLLASGGDGAKAVTPYLANPGGYGPHGWGGHGFGFIGGIFRILFFGFLIMLAFKFFAFRRWRMQQGWQGGPGQHGPWGHHHEQHPGHPQPEQSNTPAGSPPQPEENKPQNTMWINV